MTTLEWIKDKWTKFQKEKLRAEMKRKRRVLGHQAKDSKSVNAMHIIEKMPIFQEAKTVMMYFPVGHEVDCSLLLHNFYDKKTILLPSVIDHQLELHQYIGHDSLKKGKYNIPEPTTDVWQGTKIDLILVPGVAFDRQKYRMGRGGGYYDRFLIDYEDVPTIGVAYDFQVVKKLPVQKHDQRMDYIVTDKGILINA